MRVKLFLPFLSLITFVALSCGYAEADTRPKIGLVLGGGGAKGIAHVGVLKALEDMRIPIDYIAGTSMGAVVGSLYASGKSASEIEALITEIDWEDIFRDSPDRRIIKFRRKEEDFQFLSRLEMGIKDGGIRLPRALIGAQKVGLLFESLLFPVSEVTDFDRLPIPFRAVATDLENGQMIILRSGRLAEAAKASMSVPGVFPPVQMEDRYLVDGGIVRNLPVDVVREMGAEVVIAVDVSNVLSKRDKLVSPIDVLNQMLDIMILVNVDKEINTLGERDVFIKPELGDIGSMDFARGKEAASIGEKTARQHMEAIKRYTLGETQYKALMEAKRKNTIAQGQPIKVGTLTVQGLEKVSESYVKGKIRLEEGDQITLRELQRRVAVIYGSGDFQGVDLQLTPSRQDSYDVNIKAREKEWGPNYLRLGVNLESAFGSDSNYNVLVEYTMRWLNKLGSEWKNQLQFGNSNILFSEFYQPMDAAQTWYISPSVRLQQGLIDLFRGNERIAQYRVTKAEAGLATGLYIGDTGQIRLSLLRGVAKAEQRIGSTIYQGMRVHYGGLGGSITFDELDNTNFPRNGSYSMVSIYSSLRALGSDDSYSKMEGIFVKALSYGKDTFLFSLSAGAPLVKESPFYDLYSLGGFLSLSGLHNRQIMGQYMGLSRLIYYRQIGKSMFGDYYLGGSLEAGNIWASKRDISLGKIMLSGSVFIGADTLLGPLYFAFGKSEGANQALYLYLGKTF